MAKAEVKAVIETVTLTLGREEAEVLHRVLRRVGGLSSGPRGKADAVLAALSNVGIDSGHLTVFGEGVSF